VGWRREEEEEEEEIVQCMNFYLELEGTRSTPALPLLQAVQFHSHLCSSVTCLEPLSILWEDSSFQPIHNKGPELSLMGT
jgi:hypothetical protein